MPIPCPIRFVHPFPNAEDRVNRCHTRYEVLDGHLVVSNNVKFPLACQTEHCEHCEAQVMDFDNNNLNSDV